MSVEKLSGAIVVVVEHDKDGERWVLSADSASALQYAGSLTEGPVIAVACGPDPDLETLGSCGAEKVLAIGELGQESLLSEVATDVVWRALQTLDSPAEAVIIPSTSAGREVAGRLGMRLRSAVVTDVADISVEDGGLQISKRVLGGSWQTRTSLSAGTPVLTLARRDDQEPGVAVQKDVTLQYLNSDGLGRPDVTVEQAVMKSTETGAGLRDAEVVVVGGRGVDGDFELVRWLAATVSGAVGATRVACDEGWAERSVQVGQTGVSIAPEVYIGLGVSGAIHHACGIQGSKTIVAICDDPDAPIFEIADFGVIGDVHTVVPQAIARLEEIKAEA